MSEHLPNEHLADVRRFDPLADEAVVARIVKHLGVALRNRDSATVACGDDSELRTVRENWCRRKLGVEDAERVERIVALVCETMGRDRMKNRATFYYLCAKHLGRLDVLAS